MSEAQEVGSGKSGGIVTDLSRVHKKAPPGSSADTIIRAQEKYKKKRLSEETLPSRDNRGTVVNVFNSAFFLLEQTPENELTPEELWTRDSIKAAKEKTIDQGKDKFTNSFANLEKTGETFTQEEGIPTEGLLEFLRKKAEPLAPDSNEKKELIRLAHVLYRNSQPFTRLPHRLEPARLLGRVRQEAHFVSKDVRATGSDFDNWLKAERALMARLELFLPLPEAQPAAPAPEEPPEPVEEATAVAPAPAPAAEAPAAVVERPVEAAPAPAAAPAPEAQPPAAEPQPETLNEVRHEHNVTIGRRDTDIVKRARELADQLLTKEVRKGSTFNPLNWGRKIGLRVMEEYWRQRLTAQIAEAMRQNNNAYLNLDLSKSSIVALDLFRGSTRNVALETQVEKAREQEAGKAKIEQIQIGEKIEGEETIEVQGELKKMMVSEILRPIVDGQITTGEQIQQKLREFVKTHEHDPQIQAIFGRDKTQYGRLADYFAFNLIEAGEAIKQDLASHRFALEQLDEMVKIKLANMRWAAETEATFNRVDKAIAWLQRHRVGGLVANPAFVGAAFSLGTFLGLRAPGGAARVAAPFVAPIVGTLAGAAVAAARRNYDLKVDMAMHRRERAYNLQIPQGAPRREALERLDYNTASVNELINGGGEELVGAHEPRKSIAELTSRFEALRDSKRAPSGGETDEELTQITQNLRDFDQVKNALARRYGEVKARLDFSSREKIDLITFEGREQVEQGRLALVKTIVETRRALRTAGMSDDKISQFETNWNKELTKNKEQQDRSFAHYRLRNAVGAAVFGGAAGAAGGLVSQEGFAQIARHFPEAANIPVIGGLFQKGETAVERALRGIGVEVPGVPTGPTVETFRNLYQQGGNVDVGNTLRLSADKTTHEVLFSNRAGAPIPDAPKVRLDSDGILYSTGDFPTHLQNEFQKTNFAIHQGPDMEEVKTLLDPKDGPGFQEIDGHKTVIPKGTEWVPDPTDKTKWDLVIQNHPDKILVNDAQFDAAGKITYDHKTSMDPILKVSSEPDTTWFPRTQEQAVTEWKNLGTGIHHREWYSYNLPGSQENELRLHTFKDGDAVTLDMSTMKQGVQTGLTPNPIDVQEIIKNKQAGFSFSLPGHEGKPVWVPDGADGVWDGKLRLDPNDTTHFVEFNGKKITLGEFSKMVLNQDALKPLPNGDIATEVYNRREVFRLGLEGKMGTIEAGRIADRSEGKVFQAFATIFGKGEIQAEVPQRFIANVELLQRLDQIELFPTHQITPPPETEAPPIIPIPFAPRHPLEPLKKAAAQAPAYGAPYGYARYGAAPTPAEIPLREEARDVLRPAEEVLQAALPAQPITSAPPPGTPPTASPIPAPAPETTTTSEVDVDTELAELKLFLADETQTPVAPEDINDAQRGAERFVKSAKYSP